MITVVSVHVGVRQVLSVGQRNVQTGIFKTRVDDQVAINRLGLAGDAVCDHRHHGGVDQAVYVYTEEDYAFWARQYRRPFDAGGFGENVVIRGLDAAELAIGDRLRLPNVTLEVSAPRIPCGVLATAVAEAAVVDSATTSATRQGEVSVAAPALWHADTTIRRCVMAIAVATANGNHSVHCTRGDVIVPH